MPSLDPQTRQCLPSQHLTAPHNTRKWSQDLGLFLHQGYLGQRVPQRLILRFKRHVCCPQCRKPHSKDMQKKFTICRVGHQRTQIMRTCRPPGVNGNMKLAPKTLKRGKRNMNRMATSKKIGEKRPANGCNLTFNRPPFIGLSCQLDPVPLPSGPLPVGCKLYG